MARRMPSLTALLALVALAGYQNRDKIGAFVKSVSADGGMLDEAKKSLTEKAQTNAEGTTVKSALEEMLDQFRHNGEEEKAKSWVNEGPNLPASEPTLSKALGPDIIDQIAKATGLGRDEILSRLSKVLPEAVDKLTPDGKVPA
jgi:uncharacterized protein YidB (DUF937 family)